MNMEERLALAKPCLNNAISFHRSANLLYEKADGPRTMDHIIPSYVLFAFSLELYLKCLAILDSGAQLWNHDLLGLYKQISPANQSRLKELYADSVRHGLEKRLHFKATLEEAGAQMVNPDDLEAVLGESKSAFAQLRYIHEQPSKSNDGSGRRFVAGAALSASVKLIFELAPSLAEGHSP